MSRRTVTARIAVSVLALAASLVISGCSQSPAPHPSGGATHTASGPSTPTPTPTPTFVAEQYTCDSILPPATLAVFKAKQSAGFALQTDYLQRMENIGSDVVLFNTYGGILCQWAYPDTQNSVDYGFSPITATEATSEQATITKNGYTPSAKDYGTLYANPDTTDSPDEYLFINGYWFHASTDDVLQLILDNVFATPGQ